jgi:hypothetical protein
MLAMDTELFWVRETPHYSSQSLAHAKSNVFLYLIFGRFCFSKCDNQLKSCRWKISPQNHSQFSYQNVAKFHTSTSSFATKILYQNFMMFWICYDKAYFYQSLPNIFYWKDNIEANSLHPHQISLLE